MLRYDLDTGMSKNVLVPFKLCIQTKLIITYKSVKSLRETNLPHLQNNFWQYTFVFTRQFQLHKEAIDHDIYVESDIRILLLEGIPSYLPFQVKTMTIEQSIYVCNRFEKIVNSSLKNIEIYAQRPSRMQL